MSDIVKPPAAPLAALSSSPELVAPRGLDVAGLEPARLIVADPPWPFEDKLPGRGRGARKHYALMRLGAIKALTLPPIAEDAILILWRPGAFAIPAFDIMAAWGFRYTGGEVVWNKYRRCAKCEGAGVVRPRGGGVRPCANCNGEGRFKHIGMGRTVRNAHELAIIGEAGHGRRGRLRADVRSTFDALMPIDSDGDLVHSAKPDAFYELAASMYPGPRIALFERQPRPGFVCFGDELPDLDDEAIDTTAEVTIGDDEADEEEQLDQVEEPCTCRAVGPGKAIVCVEVNGRVERPCGCRCHTPLRPPPCSQGCPDPGLHRGSACNKARLGPLSLDLLCPCPCHGG